MRTINRVKLASCYANYLDAELSYLLYSCVWTLTYYLTVLLELEATDWMATHEYYWRSKSETRTTFLLFLPQTHAVLATD